MSSLALADFRNSYVGRPEWDIELHLRNWGFADRALAVNASLKLERAYEKAWTALCKKLQNIIQRHNINEASAQKAQEALLKQSFYVGENAASLNGIVHDWIENDLFKDGTLQTDALKGVTLLHNSYEATHSVESGHTPHPPVTPRQNRAQIYIVIP